MEWEVMRGRLWEEGCEWPGMRGREMYWEVSCERKWEVVKVACELYGLRDREWEVVEGRVWELGCECFRRYAEVKRVVCCA